MTQALYAHMNNKRKKKILSVLENKNLNALVLKQKTSTIWLTNLPGSTFCGIQLQWAGNGN
jgi:Xaa-Pro aminopeptidase